MRESSEDKIGIEIEIEIADADGSGSGRWDGVLEGCIGDWRLMMSQSPMLVLRHSGSLRHFTKRGMNQSVPAKQREWHSNKPRRMLKEEVYKGRAIPLDLRSRVGCAIPDRASQWNSVLPTWPHFISTILRSITLSIESISSG
jgi:hypothetical protein